jgi:aromatic-ring opening dioxygenase LigAB LigA subunit
MRSASSQKGSTDGDAGATGQSPMSDYWLNKLFFDLQQPELGAQYKKDRESVLARYPLSAELRRAVLDDDLAALAPHVNAYLLRFYFAILGVKDDEFIRRLNELPAAQATKERASSHG